MKTQRGFSLIELLIVVAIIGIISAIAVPALKRARQVAQSGSAVQSLRSLTTCQNLYYQKFKFYGTLNDLFTERLVNPDLGGGRKANYAFLITLLPQPVTGIPDLSFTCTASPEDNQTTRPYYFVDETAVIRFNEGAPATAASSPIPR